MAGRALFVIDMLNDFLRPGGALYCGIRSRTIIPYVARQIESFHQTQDPVFFICDAHRRGDYELRFFPPHCMQGSFGAELVRELVRRKKDIYIPKRFYNGFTHPNLDRSLRRHRIGKVYLAGVCTSICVMEHAAQLFYRKIPVYVYRRGVADFNDESHRFALRRMQKIFGAQLVS